MTARLVPIFLLAAWIAAVGFFMWTRAHQSLTAPGEDPLTYMEKAANTWENAGKGFPENPLNVIPYLRPPGTVLISYPFGYDGDHQGFYFRSVFFPFVLWTMAVLLVCWPIGGVAGPREAWMAVGAAIVFGSNPFFFQFDQISTSIVFWGMMDQSVGACAGLAMAAVWRSLQSASRVLLTLGVCMACFALMVKPTGILVIFSTGAFFVGSEALRLFLTPRAERRKEASLLLYGTVAFLILGGGLSLLSMNSLYLGGGTTEKTVDIQKAAMLLSERMSAWEKVEVMYFFLGIQGLAMVLAVATALALRSFRKKEAQDIFLIAFLVPMLTLGYILHARYLGGASQMRLYSPFVFIALALLLGWCAKIRFALIGMLFGKPLRLLAAVGLIVTLLAMTGPSANTGLQRLLGISINVNRG